MHRAEAEPARAYTVKQVPMAVSASPDLDLLAINTIRTLSIDAVQKTNSGHPGLPLGAAPMAYVLWTRSGC